MKILVLGAGKMGSFFLDVLSFDHETAVYEKDPKRMRFTYNCQRFTTLDEIKEFQPQLVINAVTLKYTISAFNEVLPVLPDDCIISDISSVKTNLKEFYEQSGHPYVSTHPMFGPTFANLGQLSEENAIIITEATIWVAYSLRTSTPDSVSTSTSTHSRSMTKRWPIRSVRLS